MNRALFENITAILDSQNVKSGIKTRSKFLAQECDIPKDEIEHFLTGKQSLPIPSLRKIADRFYVDVWWLLGKTG